MKYRLILWFVLIFVISNLVLSQSIKEKCAYYPLHVGDEWHYKIEEFEVGTEPIISFSNKTVVGDTILQNGFSYFIINEDENFVFERIDSLNLKVMKYELNSCSNDERDIYSLNFDQEMPIEWIDCLGTPWDVSFLNSGGTQDSSYIRLYSDWLMIQEKHLDKGWGLRFHFIGEGNSYNKYLTSAVVSGKVWGIANIDKMETNIDNFELLQNFPNPFNPSTRIKFIISKMADARITIFDLSGKIVELAEMNGLLPGAHTYKWNGEKFASGIYIFKIKIGQYIKTQKMILLK